MGAAGSLAAVSDARAQLTSESFLRNHGTMASYATSYTPGTGSDRVVVFIIASEYDLNRTENGATVPNVSEIASISLGGVPLRSFGTNGADGTRENARNKRNRLSLFYLPEAEIPSGASTFSVSYTQPASSMIYIATALNIRQDDAISAPVFAVNCRNRVWQNGNARSGPIAFAPITAAPADKVLSWVVTGDSDTRTTFRNGGTEFLDERRTSPGFSLAGALQSPQTAATIAGDARVSDGCANRPLTMQFRLRPLGQDGALAAPDKAPLGDPVTITVADPDLDLRDSAVDTVTITVTNPRTGQTISVTATETGPGTGVFSASVPTADGSGGGGVLGAANGDVLRATYEDALTASGPSATRSADTTLLSGAWLVAQKQVTSLNAYDLPGSDVLYEIEVRNDGFGSADAGSVFLVDALPALSLVVGDPVAGDGDTAPVRFVQQGAGLSFDYATDVGYAGPGAPPTSFAACPLRPGAGVTSGLGYLCVRPRGAMAAGDPDPSFTITFRMRIP